LDGGSARRKASTYTGQHNTGKTRTHIHAPSRIRTCDPSVRAAEDSTCLRMRGHWDRLSMVVKGLKYFTVVAHFIIVSRIFPVVTAHPDTVVSRFPTQIPSVFDMRQMERFYIYIYIYLECLFLLSVRVYLSVNISLPNITV
jgi:hypothetical protein